MMSLLWLLRTHYFNATNAGWGDPEQGQHQWLLGWAVRISFALAVICVSAVATFSKRVLIAITVGTALSLSSALVASWLPMVSFALGCPGLVAALYAFGVHNGGGFDVAIPTLEKCLAPPTLLEKRCYANCRTASGLPTNRA
jgi:hypothetical protein